MTGGFRERVRSYFWFTWYALGNIWIYLRRVKSPQFALKQGSNMASGDQSDSVTVHPLTDCPTKLYKELKLKEKVKKVEQEDLLLDPPQDRIRFVCISDTHSRLEDYHKQAGPDIDIVPDGDVLIHAGDLTDVGFPCQIDKFNDYLGELPHKVKIVIAGNHDLTFDDEMVKNQRSYLRDFFRVSKEKFEDYLENKGVNSVKDLLTNCVYLEDATVEVFGIKIFGSPWQPWFGGWGFNYQRGEAGLEKWNQIPSDTDVLITHGPPLGHGDMCFDNQRAGCVELLNTVQQRVRPKFHIFGHIHEGYGITTDGYTTYINASTCNLRYRPHNHPIVFDVPIPEGHSKDEELKLFVRKFQQEDLKERTFIPRPCPITNRGIWSNN